LIIDILVLSTVVGFPKARITIPQTTGRKDTRELSVDDCHSTLFPPSLIAEIIRTCFWQFTASGIILPKHQSVKHRLRLLDSALLRNNDQFGFCTGDTLSMSRRMPLDFTRFIRKNELILMRSKRNRNSFKQKYLKFEEHRQLWKI